MTRLLAKTAIEGGAFLHLLVALVGFPVSAAAVDPPAGKIVVAVPPSFPPTYFQDSKTGKAAGFAVDVMDEVARRAGLRVEYVFGQPWEEIQQMVLTGKADVVPNLTISDERKQIFLFTSPVEAVPVNFLVRSKSAKVTEPQAGMAVGVIGGSVAYSHLKKRSDVKVVTYAELQRLLFDLLSGRLDMILTATPNVRKLAAEIGAEDQIRVLEPPVFDGKRGMALRPSDRELCQRLEKAIVEFVGSDHYRALYEKWWGRPKPYWTAKRVALLAGGTLMATVILLGGWFGVVTSRLNRKLSRSLAETETEQAKLKELVDALRKSEERFRLLIELAPESIFVQSDGRFVYLNPHMLQLLGASQVDELLGKDFKERMAPEYHEAIRERIRLQVETGKPVAPMEQEYVRLDGSRVPVETTAVAIRFQDRPAHLVFVRDISARRRAEAALRQSEALLRTAGRTARFGGWSADPEGRDVIWSEQVALIHGKEPGYSPTVDEAIEFYAPECRGRIARVFQACARDGQPYDEELEIITVPGQRLWVRTTGEAVRDTSGGIIRVQGSFQDITARKRAEQALNENRERLHSILRVAPTGIGVVVNRVLSEVNSRLCEMTGYTCDELLGQSSRLLYPTEADFLYVGREKYRQIAERGTGTVETRWRKKDGSIIEVLLSSTPIDPADPARGVTFTALDITDRKRAEEQLRESVTRLRTVVSGAPIVLYSFDRHGVFTFSEGRGHASLGLKPDEVVGRTVFEVCGEEPAAIAALRRAMAGETFTEEMSFPTGGIFEVSHVALRDEAGDYAGTIGVLVDITERKRVEAALKESEERYRNFIRNATEGIYRIDFLPPVGLDLPEQELVNCLAQNAIVGEVNDHLARMYGLSVGDMVGRRATDFAPNYGERALLAVRAPNFQVRDQETQDVNPAGQAVFLLENFTGVVEQGHLVHIWGMQRDITEHRRAEEERRRLQAQLAQAQKMESVGRLAGGVAHDFNNMLQAILGNTALALADLPPQSPLRETLEEIQKSAERSADLTRQLLAFARKQTIAPRVLDLNEAVAATLKMLRRLIGEDINLAWLPGSDLGLVNVDPSQVDQLLANLCVNARDAIGGAAGTITIKTANAVFDDAYVAGHPEARAAEYVRLAVSDNGCGMSPEVRAHLFEPFFTTKGLGQGTGLGLAMVYGIVKQNDGFINVYSEPGRGTNFEIHLPRYTVPAVRTVQGESAPAPGRGHETILLVEDEPSILRVSRRMLENLGYTVLAARTPGEAIQVAREHVGEIHLLMTDVVMPEMNGRELARNLLSQYPNLKRLFMSGYTANVIAHHGVLDPGVNFIQKPFSIQNLADKVREALNGS